MNALADGQWHLLKYGDDKGAEPTAMRFHLTYEGVLYGASRNQTRAEHKHQIRKVFHEQLKRLWEISPRLSRASTDLDGDEAIEKVDYGGRLGRYDMFGHRFVPLLDEGITVLCELRILLLRADAPGAIVKSGDIDNRLKTLIDALRLPHNKDEVGDGTGGDEPFFCLLRDDALIERLEVRADALLQPVSSPPNVNDVRVVIEVVLRPYAGTIGAIAFV